MSTLGTLRLQVDFEDVLLHLEHDARVAHLGVLRAEAPTQQVADAAVGGLHDDVQHMIEIGRSAQLLNHGITQSATLPVILYRWKPARVGSGTTGGAVMGTTLYRRFALPALKRLDAEAVHHHTLALLRAVQAQPLLLALLRRHYQVDDPRLRVTCFGREFANPLGLAAGFDKNGTAPTALAALGFGHIEVGTATPRPQPGRPRPRIFRLPEDAALINRLGFPSEGMTDVATRLRAYANRRYVLGVNVGPNVASVEAGAATADYLAALAHLAPHADYLTINVSSPNTQGLRALQAAPALEELLQAVFAMQARTLPATPVLLKIAPDLSDDQLDAVLQVALAHPVAGIIAANTTLARPASLVGAAKQEAGGLSGQPLRDRSTQVIRAIYQRSEGRLPIIGVGGIASAADAIEKLRAGASLLQLYTGMIYQGPAVVRSINRGLLAYMHANGVASVGDLVGQA
jgi:dihydroorotate dehydrogenase